MRVLVDEGMPVQVIPCLRLNRKHEFDHVDDLGWKGRSDVRLFAEAADSDFDAILTLELKLLNAVQRHEMLDPRKDLARFPYWR